MQYLTISALNAESGIDRRRLIELLQTAEARMEGKRKLYTWRQLISALLETGRDLTAERTRLTSAQADKVELEGRRLRGELIPIDDVREVLGRLVSAVRARFLGLPSKLAAVAVSMTEPEIEAAIAHEVHEALHDLSTGYRAPTDSGAPTETDGESVGGPEPETE